MFWKTIGYMIAIIVIVYLLNVAADLISTASDTNVVLGLAIAAVVGGFLFWYFFKSIND